MKRTQSYEQPTTQHWYQNNRTLMGKLNAKNWLSFLRQTFAFVIGLCGWFILHNGYVHLLLQNGFYIHKSAMMSLILLLVPYAVFAVGVFVVKNKWFRFGIILAVLLTGIIWALKGISMPFAFLFPYPSGMWLLLQ
jgi:hypothetical protein